MVAYFDFVSFMGLFTILSLVWQIKAYLVQNKHKTFKNLSFLLLSLSVCSLSTVPLVANIALLSSGFAVNLVLPEVVRSKAGFDSELLAAEVKIVVVGVEFPVDFADGEVTIKDL